VIRTSARAESGPSVVVVAIDRGADVTLVGTATDAVAKETVDRHRAGGGVHCDNSVLDHRRRHTARCKQTVPRYKKVKVVDLYSASS